jgi:F420-dependent oxidoreductase-like protein
MRLALELRAINTANPSPEAYVELARAAERFGYEAIWAPELRSTDPFALLGWIGSHTSGLGLGCAVAQVTARTAVAMASGAMTLNGLSGGRFHLGLGVSGPQVVEGWHGRAYDRPLTHLREYLTVVRMALNGEPIRFTGREINLPVPFARDDVTPIAFPRSSLPLPVHLAGIGRNAVALAGELADGWIAIHCPPDYVATARSWLQEGAARSGRSLDGFVTSVGVMCSVDDDEELARDIARPTLALYLGGMGTHRTNFYNRLAGTLGFTTAAATVRDAYLAGRIEEAIAAVDDELLDAMTACGSPERVREKLAAYRKAGADAVIISLPMPSHRARIDQLELISALL